VASHKHVTGHAGGEPIGGARHCVAQVERADLGHSAESTEPASHDVIAQGSAGIDSASALDLDREEATYGNYSPNSTPPRGSCYPPPPLPPPNAGTGEVGGSGSTGTEEVSAPATRATATAVATFADYENVLGVLGLASGGSGIGGVDPYDSDNSESKASWVVPSPEGYGFGGAHHRGRSGDGAGAGVGAALLGPPALAGTRQRIATNTFDAKGGELVRSPDGTRPTVACGLAEAPSTQHSRPPDVQYC
jgi:hypothetical protein